MQRTMGLLDDANFHETFGDCIRNVTYDSSSEPVDIWPYVSRIPRDDLHPFEGEVVNRVFCPWDYPPDPLRAFRRNIHMRLERVEIVRLAGTAWEWRLTAKAI